MDAFSLGYVANPAYIGRLLGQDFYYGDNVSGQDGETYFYGDVIGYNSIDQTLIIKSSNDPFQSVPINKVTHISPSYREPKHGRKTMVPRSCGACVFWKKDTRECRAGAPVGIARQESRYVPSREPGSIGGLQITDAVISKWPETAPGDVCGQFRISGFTPAD